MEYSDPNSSINERLTIVETKIEIIQSECDEIIDRQKETNVQLTEIKEMLISHNIIQDKLKKDDEEIHTQISQTIMPVVNDYNNKLQMLDNFISLITNKYVVSGFIVLFGIIVYILMK